ncbi:T9SS type A sorting domain-containing protein [bacterium]|nr:T9SS type A sorting domain-containing protein [bacterium]
MFTRILLILIILSGIVHAQPDSLWSNTYGGMNTDYCYYMIQTTDGGFALTGIYDDDDDDDHDYQFCLVKTDSLGEEEWLKTYGTEISEWAWAVAQTVDDGFIIAGESSTNEEGTNGYVVKTDSDGEMEWSRNYHDGSSEQFRMVKVIDDSSYILAGYGNSVNGDNDCWLVKINSDGEVIWSRWYGGDHWDEFQDVDPTPDGGFILSGTTFSFGAGDADGYIIKVDSEGEVEWSRTYGTERFEMLSEIERMPDGGYVLGGSAVISEEDNDDYLMYAVRIDSTGEEIWSRTFDGTCHCYSVILIPEGGIILAGTNGRFALIRLDFDGNEIWRTAFGRHSECIAVVRTPEGGYALGGSTLYYGREGVRGSNFWLVKTGMDMVRWLPIPDTAMCEHDTLIYDLSYFCDYVTPSVSPDSLLGFSVRNGIHANGEIVDNQLIITADEGEYGLDRQFRLIAFERRDESNCDTTYLHITILEDSSSAIEATEPDIPIEFGLCEAYPNPFNSTTTISFGLDKSAPTRMALYDLSGREVVTLFEGFKQAGCHTATLTAGNLASGLYFVRLEAGGFSQSRKLMLIR